MSLTHKRRPVATDDAANDAHEPAPAPRSLLPPLHRGPKAEQTKPAATTDAEPLEATVIDTMEQALLKCIRYVLLSMDPQQARNMANYMLYVCHRVGVLSPLAQALEQNAEVQQLLQKTSETTTKHNQWQRWLWSFLGRTPTVSPASSPRGQGPRDDMLLAQDDENLEVGWAVRYMQREAKLPKEVSCRMKRMMHTEVPLNLFRAEVEYVKKDADVIGFVTPDSFPPTPMGRQNQTQRTTFYTVAVLDLATKALQDLQAQSSSATTTT
ncbi:hypothetical protein SPRG_00598 [Saprolegnia parasitica CBS 223.65]|uniref:Uncharacterized protein n=1 Tax=Saprolegnia parasitica (strain CBS 223.65) TaxID=695850 RepID=A0A067CZ36_SAPPC|nr:hypothetical protein SPRG_00598 [Saprolegnia parasitica CBS 223.65]KDO34535.1 hypothetical protein SPRG_00598 [Saprolegnia parasitica CBS 223.65]|eukprot:XP_012194213.1 hypothetical protein SPRG_00598 [Saprolegnia parasitica CBS 223.65]